MNDSPNPYPDTVSDLLWEKASTKERKWIRQHEEQHKQVKMLLTEKERLSWIATLLSRGSEGDWRVRMAIALALGNSEEFLKWMLMQEVR